MYQISTMIEILTKADETELPQAIDRRSNRLCPMRNSGLVIAAAVSALCIIGSTSAFADRDGRGGPLPLLGLSALGQLGSVVGGACLVWRRRRKQAALKNTRI